MTPMNSLDPTLLAGSKRCFSVRRIPMDLRCTLDRTFGAVGAGDVVYADVLRIGQHARVQLADGRYSRLFPGDRLLLACGDRFASDQFVGRAEVTAEGRADLLAGGGVIGQVEARHDRMAKATRLRVLGRLLDATGNPLHLSRFALPGAKGETVSWTGQAQQRAPVFAVFGSGMNAGKTEAAAALIHALSRLGRRPGAIKVTGTTAFCDLALYEAAGATAVLDFTDAGMASTFRQPLERIESACRALLAELQRRHCDCAVLEFADGVGQVETAALLQRGRLRPLLDLTVFAAADTLSAEAGVARLTEAGLAPALVTGLVTRSPTALNLPQPVLTRDALMDPASASMLLNGLQTLRGVA